ncbi:MULTISPECIES: YhgE/Pip domain-containing protein [Paenibacillus]|nr:MULTISPECIES: YhgE/Pip domain-containing protein [Paenibacillus]
MKRIWSIYATDMRNVGRNWAASVIVLGLIFLPSLYAWFNILASWDPYSNTGSLAIAVVNQDLGTTVNGRELHIGDEIVASLRADHRIGWTFVEAEQAMKGVRRGDYYASLTIPPDFSERIASVLTESPRKAEIVYDVNEKINAIAPKITSKGASGILEEVSRSFIKTANGAIFEIMNKVGLELERGLPTIEAAKTVLFRVEALLPEVEQAVGTGLADIEKAQDIVRRTESYLPEVAKLADTGQAVTAQLGQWLERSDEALNSLAPGIKHDLFLLQQAAIATEQLTGLLQDAKLDPAALQAELERVRHRLTVAGDVTSRMLTLFERLNGLTGGKGSAWAAGKLQQLQSSLQMQTAIVGRIADAIAKGAKPADALVNDLARVSRDVSAVLGDVLERYDGEIAPGIADGVERAKTAARKAHDALIEAQSSMPDVTRIVGDASRGLATGREELLAVQQALPRIGAKIKELADRVRAFEREGNLGEILRLLKLDAQKESEFFAEPVILKENKLFPIPNYGSAMSPFFTTLSLWVGALLLVSLLSVDLHAGEAAPYTSREVYLGRYLTFLTFALPQSLFVTLGDLYLLHTYAANPFWFIAFGLVLSALFMLIVYTLVSVFGNVGKAMSIVLLVLQLAGSGGTFPVQLTPPFFQAIHPFLPFTYAIGLMREAVGGILWELVFEDLRMLALYAAIALLIGLALKEWINASSAKLVNKARESKLIH